MLVISDWGNCTSYKEFRDYLDKKTGLIERLPVPVVLRSNVDQLTRQSEEAQRKIEEADRRESEAMEKIDSGIQHRKVTVISWGASLLQSCIKHKIGDQMWNREDDILPLVSKVNEAKQHIIQEFPAWLSNNRPSGISFEALSEFKREMIDRIAGNLRNLDLAEQRDMLVKYVDNFSRRFEAIVDAQQKLTNADNWLANNVKLPKDATIVQLDTIKMTMEQQSGFLKPCRATMKRIGHIGQEPLVVDLTDRIDKIDETLVEVIKMRKEIDKRAKAIWNTKLNLFTANDILDEVSDLIRLYHGSAADIDDFRIMRNVLTEFLDISHRLDNLQISKDDFSILSSDSRNSFVTKYADEEPPWDLEQTFDAMVSSFSEKRTLASRDWVTRMEQKYNDIETLSLQEGNEGLYILSLVPPYFNPTEGEGKINRLKKKLEKHLESKGVEWLYEKYIQLTPTAQKAFLALLKK